MQNDKRKPLQILERLLAKRERLHVRWRAEHANLDDRRNITAGEIYQNTKDLEAACADLCKAGYAAEWVQRWVGGME